ncbi:amidohydrolase [Kibdelosporangium lantanae]
MTVLDSRAETTGGDPVVPVAGTTASMPTVEDIGAGRGPSWLDGWLAGNIGEIVAWYRHLHANPELSRQEFKTTQLLATMLAAAGLKPEIGPTGTGVICEVGSGDRCVALRADIDALPLQESTGLPYASTVDGVAHSCGHDAHTTILLAAGLALAAAPELPGRVRMVFQPAEEVMPGGALDMIAGGALDGVERIFGLHCDPRVEAGRVGTRVGAITSATDLLELRLTSPGGHTSRPHLTADLVHALGTVITGLPALLSRRVDPRSGTVLVWGAVHAGEAPNAVPEEGLLRGTLRTGDHEIWAELEPLVAGLVQSLLTPSAWATSCTTAVVCHRSSTTASPPRSCVPASSPLWAGTRSPAPSSRPGRGLRLVPGARARLLRPPRRVVGRRHHA